MTKEDLKFLKMDLADMKVRLAELQDPEFVKTNYYTKLKKIDPVILTVHYKKMIADATAEIKKAESKKKK